MHNVENLTVDSFLAKRAEEVEQLNVKLASATSLVSDGLNDIDEAQDSASRELVANLDQLLQHCSHTEVCAAVCYVELAVLQFAANGIGLLISTVVFQVY